jgi:phage shock protein A
MLIYDRSTASSTASLEPLERMEALQRINTDLSKKLIEAEKTLQNRLTEHESELEEMQSRLEELRSELTATKKEEKELRAKEASVIFHLVLMNADCPETD